ncbi:MAG: tol-pal system-associated acyl-CoA thioesterase [Gemmatimonas sp.]
MSDTVPAFVHRVRVYYEDTDTAGVVYYANYLKFAERGRTEALRSIGIDQRAFAASAGVQFVVRRVEADFRVPARLDDELEVVTRTVDIGGASLTMEQTIRREGETLVAMRVEICSVTAGGPRAGRPVRMPREVAERLGGSAERGGGVGPTMATISPQISKTKRA